MDQRNALRLALSMSGKYDLPGKKLTLKGYDMYGMPMQEEVPETDGARMEADIDAILCGEKPSPIRHIDLISVGDTKL